MRLALESVGYSYGRRRALSDVTMPPTDGVVGVLGPNASGKSTLMKVVAGLLRGEGRVAAWDDDGRPLDDTARRQAIGYVPQEPPGDVALTVLETVVVGLRRRASWHTSAAEVEAATGTLDELGILHLAHRYLGELSGGQRQLVGIAQMTARRPPIMLLDEPTSALDLHHQLKVLDFVRRRTHRPSVAAAPGAAASEAAARSAGSRAAAPPDGSGARGVTLVPMHDLNLAARFCDHVLVLAGGRTVTFGPPALALTPQVLADTYRVDARVLVDGAVPVIAPVGLTG